MVSYERALSPKTFDVPKGPHTQKKHIFGNYARALRGPNDIFGRSEMVSVAMKRYYGDLAEPRDLTKSGSLKGPWWATGWSSDMKGFETGIIFGQSVEGPQRT